MEEWDYKQKMQHDMKLMAELKDNYDLVNMLFIICIDRGLKLVLENPYSKEHFLQRYWCFKPAIVDKDRRDSGDYYKKPTQYWFLNCEPKNNFLTEPIEYNFIEYHGEDVWLDRRKADYEKTGAKTIKEARSMIHSTYANKFIRRYLID